MRAELQSAGQKDGLAFLRTAAEIGGRCTVAYGTRTGALLRVNGVAAGAFDREHATMICDLPANADMTLEVELRALPTNGLPSGPGLRWWLMNLLATQRPAQTLTMIPADAAAEASGERATLPLIGHSHLDVGWLWTYAQTRRKAMRTFAIAVNLLEQYPQFQFSQSQAQLYDFVRDDDSELFERVRALAAQDRFDVSVAALWVESDCNLPSGESLLRQMLSAHRFCREHFNRTPEVAWLPDSFGFANTLPTLLAHAEIRYFVTTKLQWNDTTLFPHPQFRWHGPDGSEVVAALIDSYDGGLNPWRVARARSRGEPLVAGYGDGGGGVTDEMIRQATHVGRWIRPIDWLRTLDANSLPQHQDELYLEYHRGVYTTHHNIKQRNAQLERKLGEAEYAVARCIANRSVSSDIREWCREIDEAWLLVLRNQFHDVLPGTSIAEVYGDVHQEYDRAERLIERVMQRAYDVIPPRGVAESRCVVTESVAGGAYVFH
ncbi:MAG: hypothetical protein JOZ97_08400, partial [Candidatus Eremiobacteraeota bacterium]|nr:hypothetical protein [Candidatus Eremiobacteraeota bacterium]